MFVKSVSLLNFRSYEKREFNLEKTTVVVGENGSGKSNLLEALYLLSIGRSFRADRDMEMVHYYAQLAVVGGQLAGGLELRVEIVEGRKRFLVNGVPRRMVDFVGNLPAVLFAPTDIDLISGSPSGRRRYLDFVLCQLDREYRRCLISYEKGLRQRNRLLDLIRDGVAQRTQLFFWDRLLIKNGDYIAGSRDKYLASLNDGIYKVIYDRSLISESRLAQYEQEEVAAGNTLVGPHRDDFIIECKSIRAGEYKEVSKYGSRGGQRMAVFWLKRHEMEYLGGEPLLLLDDIFSELDHRHRQEVEEMVANYPGQVVMTTADEHQAPVRSNWNIIRL